VSWRHGLAAGQLPIPDPTAKAVLNALAFHADDWQGKCWPDLDRLMLFTGLSKRAVQNGLRRLEQLNYVKTETSKGRGWANVYTLKLPDVPAMRQGKKDAPPAQKGAAGASKGAAPASQESGRIIEQTLTEAWRPDQETIEWAQAEWPNGDVEHEIKRFISVNLSTDKEIKNVRQAFRAWILRGKQLPQRTQESRRAATRPANDGLRSIAGKGTAQRA
jgi:hypothetical protein